MNKLSNFKPVDPGLSVECERESGDGDQRDSGKPDGNAADDGRLAFHLDFAGFDLRVEIVFRFVRRLMRARRTRGPPNVDGRPRSRRRCYRDGRRIFNQSSAFVDAIEKVLAEI